METPFGDPAGKQRRHPPDGRLFDTLRQQRVPAKPDARFLAAGTTL